MPRQPVSLTLDEANLLWLRGRARVSTSGNLSEAVNQLVSDARAGQRGAVVPSQSVVGTIDLPLDDPELHGADEALRAAFTASIRRPLVVRDAVGETSSTRTRSRKASGGRARRG
jgi:hypothetical protein